jgi:hypothetical protein
VPWSRMSRSYTSSPPSASMECRRTGLLYRSSNFICFVALSAFVADNISCVLKLSYQLVYCCLVRYFLVMRHIAKNFTNCKRFRHKVMFKMNVRFAPEHTKFTLARLLCNWRMRRPSNEGDLESSVSGEDGRVHCTGRPASDLCFIQYTM